MLCYYYQNSSDNNNDVCPIIALPSYVSCVFYGFAYSYAEFYDVHLILIRI